MDPYLIPHTKHNSKLIMNVNDISKALKLFKEQ